MCLMYFVVVLQNDSVLLRSSLLNNDIFIVNNVNLIWFIPMKVIDRTMAVTQHFLENSFKKLSIKKKIKKIKNPKKTKI